MMGDLLYDSWRSARIKQLRDWPLKELIVLRDKYGLSMDPRDEYDLAHEIAKAELDQIRGLTAAEPHNTTYIIGELDPYDILTSSGHFIHEVILPEFLRHFFAKNNEYRDNHRTGLGIRAEYVGLHRKIRKLQAAVWDGEDLEFEQPQELLWDVMGSCLLMLDLIAQEESETDGT
jgi:hypothetical protein